MTTTTMAGFPSNSQVKVMRHRVLQHDLDMYQAISGRRPAVPLPDEPTEKAVKVRTAAKAKGWSPIVLAIHLGNYCSNRFAFRVMKPEMADWVRKLSGHAIERLHEAQARLTASRDSNASRPRSDPPQMN